MRKKPFKTESKRVLDLMINSIYTNKEIFLRELISNASDAMDKLYFNAMTEGGTGIDRGDMEIFIRTDKESRSLIISDNGIGITRDELENNLGTIAKSGTMDFKQINKDSIQKQRPEQDDDNETDSNEIDSSEKEIIDEPEDSLIDIDIIGQFGVGFYSSFMVAKRINVISRAYGADEVWRWSSEGADGYTIQPDSRDSFGTTIQITLKENNADEDYDRFLEQYTIRNIVKKYSDYIRYPIKMEMTKSRQITNDKGKNKNNESPEYENYQEIETLNSMVPLWRRNKNEVKPEDYNRFYTEKFHDYEEPLIFTHISVEGIVFYNGLLYIPAHAPYDYYSKEYEKGLQLYSNGVLIMDKCADLLPDCFSFVKGLVDSPDLSLNISRETLQQDRQVKAIAANLDRRIKSELLKMQKDDREKYEKFFEDFGLQLKFGVYNSYGADKEKLQGLLLYHSLKLDKLITLEEYRDEMPEDQQAIYYACGISVARISLLPQTEMVLDKGYDILALTDDVDEFAIKIINEYKEKPILSVSDKDLDIDDEQAEKLNKAQTKANKKLFISMKDALGDKVKEVRLSRRLKSHPVCLTSDGPLSLEMEKVLNSMPVDQQVKADKVLEINASHPVFEILKKLEKEDTDKLKTYSELLYNQALLIEGLAIEDPVAFANAICGLMT